MTLSKIFLCSSIASIVGGVTGFIIGRKTSKLLVEQNDIHIKELTEDLELYQELNERLSLDVETMEDSLGLYVSRYGNLDASTDLEVPDELPEIPSYTTAYRTVNAKPELEKLVRQYNQGILQPEEDIPPTEHRSEEPYEISESEVDSEIFEIIQLEYYPVDTVLTDDRGSKISCPILVTGELLWRSLPTNDNSSVFVRHDSRYVIYEILINHGLSYYRDICGEGE